MIEVSQVLECKQLRSQGASVRAISHQLGISRNTVRRYLRGEGSPGAYQMQSPRPRPVRDAIGERVCELLVAERERRTPRKQRLTAARVHRLLLAEGQVASECTVRRVVRAVRLELRDPLEHAYLPLEYDPGVDAQVDFYEGVVDDRRLGRVKVILLLVRACFSGACFAYAAPNQTREALFEGLMRAFEHFGGVFQKLWFDNLTPAVKKVLQGRTRELQRAFEAFQAHYGFEALFCGPGKGNEKGGVEGSVKYSRHEILSPIPTVDGREDVQVLCDAWMQRELVRTMRGRERSIGELWSLETEHLIALPPRALRGVLPAPDQALAALVGAGGHQLLLGAGRVGRPRGRAAPRGRAGRGRWTRRHGDRAPPAATVSGEMSLELDHYLPLLARKHRGLDRAVPVRRFLEREDPCWSVLLAELRRRDGEIEGSKAFVEVLFLCRRWGVEAVTEAVRKALRRQEVSLGLVRFHLWNGVEQQCAPAAPIDYPGPAVRPASVADYAELLSSAEVAHG